MQSHTRTPSEYAQIIDINSTITQLTQFADGRFVTSSSDGILRSWNISDDSATCISSFYSTDSTNSTSAIIALQALSHQMLVVAYENNSIEFWSMTGKVPTHAYQFNPTELIRKSALEPENIIALAVLPGDYLVCGFSSGAVRAWQLDQLNMTNLCLKRNSVTIDQFLLRNTVAVGPLGKTDMENLPATLFASQQNNLLSLHYATEPKDNKGYLKLWRVNEVSKTLELQDTITYPAYAGRTTALVLLPNGRVVTAKNNKLSVSQLAQDSSTKRYGLLPMPWTNITVADGISHLLNNPNHPDQFVMITTKGHCKLMSVTNFVTKAASFFSNEESQITIREESTTSLDLEDITQLSHPLLLSNGYIAINNAQQLLLQKIDHQQTAQLSQRYYFSPAEEIPKSFPKIDINTIGERKLIGSGGFGKVYQAKLDNKIAVVLKQARNSKGEALLMSELKLHIQFSHDHIVQMFGFAQHEENTYLVMEHMAGGDLYQLMTGENSKQLSYAQRINIASEISYAIVYLHNLAIVHRDIKMENVLFNSRGQAKLTDFGLAAKWDKNTTGVPGMTGTPMYLAPETWLQKISNLKTDIFMFAIFLWDLSAHGQSYTKLCGLCNQTKIKNFITDGNRPPIPEDTPISLTNLITRCWDQDSKNRPVMDEVCRDLEGMTTLSR